MSAAEEQRWVGVMLQKLAAQESRRTPGDDELAARAERLSDQYLDGRAVPDTVRWVTNQNSRWGSCTPSEGSIRLSHRLRGMPEYVIDYVLLHELAHLLVPGHGPGFWRLLESYPRTERARGFLEGVVAAERLPRAPAGPDDDPGPGGDRGRRADTGPGGDPGRRADPGPGDASDADDAPGRGRTRPDLAEDLRGYLGHGPGQAEPPPT